MLQHQGSDSFGSEPSTLAGSMKMTVAYETKLKGNCTHSSSLDSFNICGISQNV